MKKKDVITLSICVILLLGSLVLIYVMLFPQKAKQAAPSTSDKQQEERITGNFDPETLQKVSELKNYVSTNLDNIGRTDPFGPLN